MNLQGTELGKYQLETEIGRGGMGIVYRGFDPTLARRVAVKVLAPHLVWQQEFVERFLREARSAARLKHPHIVTIYDVGEQAGNYYFVMEYIEGQALSQVLRGGRRLAVDEVLSILYQLADALDYAHRLGVIHRDVKPANVRIDPQGHATLTDFGLARAAEETRLTATGTAVGTPQYMSPEQITGHTIGPAADLYSLAIIAYEMLAGEPPFDADTTPTILYQQVHVPPPSILNHRPDLPNGVDTVLNRALSKEPADRYESSSGFVAALENALKNQVTEKVIPIAPTRAEEEAPQSVARRKSVLPTRTVPWVWIVGAALVPLAILAAFWLSKSDDKGVILLPTMTPEATVTTVRQATLSPTPSITAVASQTPKPSVTTPPTATSTPTPTNTPLPTPTPTLGIGSTTVRPADRAVMVYVPGSTFQMGSTEEEIDTAFNQCVAARGSVCRQSWYADESPQHSITLGDFWIDQTEVTNLQYNACVRDGACEPSTLADNQGLSGAEWPVVGVDWDNARAFCRWVGGDLPTEAEWEYAARGPDGYIYPWGDTFDGTRLNSCDLNCAETWGADSYDDGNATTAPAGSFPDGASWCGAVDMAGNVWEWVYDWFGAYPSAAQTDPIGASSGPYKVLRGGGWNSLQSDTRTASRWNFGPTPRGDLTGFRCMVPVVGAGD